LAAQRLRRASLQRQAAAAGGRLGGGGAAAAMFFVECVGAGRGPGTVTVSRSSAPQSTERDAACPRPQIVAVPTRCVLDSRILTQTQRCSCFNQSQEVSDMADPEPPAGSPTSRPPDDLCDMAFACELMEDPVVAADGYTYNRKEITLWFTKHNVCAIDALFVPTCSHVPCRLLPKPARFCPIKC
jgi:hypothetical protein